jgi:putative Mg2+ transporter-C (MgtC) family protein
MQMRDVIIADFLAMFPDVRELVRMLTRLAAALAVGALVGFQRERMGKAAGLRTHILVSMGTALLVISSLESGMDPDAVSRVVQGLVTGIGFLGAGTILKLREEKEIRGLTTAAGIWMTAATSVAIGLGQVGVGLIAGVVTWVVLSVLHRFAREREVGPGHGHG